MADIVYIYKHSGDGGLELKHSLRSLKHLKLSNGRVTIVGDREDWFSNNIHHIPTANPSENRMLDANLKWLQACQSSHVEDNFLAFNDDFFCLPTLEYCMLINDVSYDIIDIYEMYSKWLREKEEDKQSLLNARKSTVANGRNGRSISEEGIQLQRSEVQSSGLQEADEAKHVVYNARTKNESARLYRTGKASPRKSWNEVDKDISRLVGYETALHESESHFLEELRWKGNNSPEEMAYIFWVLRGHGSSTSKKDDRETRQRQGLLKRKLHLDNTKPADEKHKKDEVLDSERAKEVYDSMGGRDWDTILEIATKGNLGFRRASRSLEVLHGVETDNLPVTRHHSTLIKETGYWLRRVHNIAKPLNYSLHTPMLMNKANRIAVHHMIEPSLHTPTPLEPRTVYGNLFSAGSQYYEDAKTYNQQLPRGVFISTSEYTPALAEMFSEPSIYEA